MLTADNLPGMAFPPLHLKKPEGLGLYTKQPQVTDQMQRGDFTGKRIETVTYVCEQQGIFTIAEAYIQWWNPKSETLQNIVLKSVVLTVDANPFLQKETPADIAISETDEFSWKWVTVLLFFSGITGAVFIWQRSRKADLNLQITDKEMELFDKFQKAAVSQEAAATMQALLHWLNYSGLGGSSGSLTRFVELADDSELRVQIEALEKTLYAREDKRSWSGDKLYSAVQRARKELKQHKTHGMQQSLPALNP